MKSYFDYINSIENKVTNHIEAMLAYWDKDLVCRFANAAYGKWFGKTQEEMINKITLLELLGPKLYESNLSFITGALNGKIQTFEREITLPNGVVNQTIANYYPDIVDGKVEGIIVHVADVTPLKTLQTELIKSNEIVNEQNGRLLNFSNIISHNLKSYSNNLASILDLLTDTEDEDEKTKMLEYLKSISKGFSSTVDDLNEIVKNQNQAKINPERINLYTYIENAIKALFIEIESSKGIIKNNVNKDTEITANALYMESILFNLLSNAIKYRQPDIPPVIEIKSFYENGKIVLQIKDNGKGIDLDKHGANLFGMYKTFHGNSDAQGIGLFITKYQIETMGGQIKVESAVNNGSCFSIYFVPDFTIYFEITTKKITSIS